MGLGIRCVIRGELGLVLMLRGLRLLLLVMSWSRGVGGCGLNGIRRGRWSRLEAARCIGGWIHVRCRILGVQNVVGWIFAIRRIEQSGWAVLVGIVVCHFGREYWRGWQVKSHRRGPRLRSLREGVIGSAIGGSIERRRLVRLLRLTDMLLIVCVRSGMTIVVLLSHLKCQEIVVSEVLIHCKGETRGGERRKRVIDGCL